MPTSAATVQRQTVVLGEKRFKRGVCAAMATAAAALRIGDILARDSNGRLVQCFASASSNTDSDANTKIAGIATFATDVPTVVGTEIDFMSAEDQLEFLLPLVVDTGSAPTAWSQAFEGKVMGLRRVKNDHTTTNLQDLYVAVTDLNTASTSPLYCVRKDPDTASDTVAYGVFRFVDTFTRP